MSTILISGGRIIDPSQEIDFKGSILIKNGIVDSCFREGHEFPIDNDTEIVNANGLVVTPGFIDLHTHLREPGSEQKETIASGSLAAVRGGFTTICPMPNTSPPMDNPDVINRVLESAKEIGICRVLPIASVTVGRQGNELSDMIGLSKIGVIGFSDDGDPVSNPHIMRAALKYSRAVGLPIINHCQDLSISNQGVMNEGTVSHRLGLLGMPISAESTMAARDIELLESTKGKLHLAHISARRTLELIQDAKSRGLCLTAEVTPHHLLLTENWVLGKPMRQLPPSKTVSPIDWVSLEAFDTQAKVNPPLRTISDTEFLVSGLRDGSIDAIATDHAPHRNEDKATTFQDAAFGISGLETAFGLLMTLVHNDLLDLSTLVKRLTVGPAQILGARHGSLGTLKPGSVADVTVLNPNTTWEVDSTLFASRGRNTPLEGMVLKGKVVLTLYKGAVVYRDEINLKDDHVSS